MLRRPGHHPVCVKSIGIAIWLIAAVVLLVGSVGAASGAPSIRWTPNAVTHVIGNGEAAADTVLVQFISSERLRNVALWVTPELGRFVTVTPDRIAQVEPGIAYECELRFSVPPRATAAAYFGTVHLRLGARTIAEPLPVTVNVAYPGVVIPDSTRVLGRDSESYLESVSADRQVLIFSSLPAELSGLDAGDVLVLGQTAKTPLGLLRRVLSVVPSSGGVLVFTGPAAISDALETASLSVTRALTQSDLLAAGALVAGVSMRFAGEGGPAAQDIDPGAFYFDINGLVVYDQDRNPDTTEDQVTLDGSVSLAPSLTLNMSVDGANLQHLVFAATLHEEISLTVSSKAELASLEEEREIYRWAFSPFTVWVGWVPVVIQPNVTLNAGVEGDLSVGLAASVTQEATATAGVGYATGVWTPIAELHNSFTFDRPQLSLSLHARGFAGPRVDLLLYGVAGPYVTVDAYLDLDADVFETPWWSLYAGLEASAGVRAEIFGEEIADEEFPGVIGYRVLLAEAQDVAPGVGAVRGLVQDAVTRSPLSGVTVLVYGQTSVVATGGTDGNGQFSIDLPARSGYRIEFTRAGYMPATYDDVTVPRAATTYLEAVLQVDDTHSGPGMAAGVIANALTGSGVSGLLVSLRSGINARAGTVVASTHSGAGGSYRFDNLPGGNYTAEVSGPGYVTMWFTVLSVGGTLVGNQNAAITPALAPDEVRVILTWGASPADLDSHLTGPLPDGSRFHLYFPYAESNNGSPWPDYVMLDHDDITSYGPETVTVLRQIPGVYRYSVLDYTNQFSSLSHALSGSGAQVRVYRGSELVAFFNVPPAQGGTLWAVFELEGEEIRAVNSMSYVSSASGIGASSAAVERGDTLVLQGLPAKR